MFVTHSCKCNYSEITVMTFVCALNFMHKLYDMPSPLHKFIVEKATAGVQKLNPQFGLRLQISFWVLTPSQLQQLSKGVN